MFVYNILFSCWNEKTNKTTFQVVTVTKRNIVEVAGEAICLEQSWNNGQQKSVYKFVAASQTRDYSEYLAVELGGKVVGMPEN